MKAWRNRSVSVTMVIKNRAHTDNSPDSELAEQLGHMNGGPKTKKVTGWKETATNQQRIEVPNWYHPNGRHQTLTAQHFDPMYPSLHLKQPIISSWVKDEVKWQVAYKADSGLAWLAKCVLTIQHPQVTEMLELWVEMACKRWDDTHWRNTLTEMVIVCRLGQDPSRWVLCPQWGVANPAEGEKEPEGNEVSQKCCICTPQYCREGEATDQALDPVIWVLHHRTFSNGWDRTLLCVSQPSWAIDMEIKALT